jgi:hypothetical protein
MGLTNWMSDIDGRMYLSQLSIPGAHDALSYNFTLAAKDQDLDVTAQLAAGIRWFDLRLKSGIANNARILYGIHGSIETPVNEFKAAVITPTIAFLNANPGECVVFEVTNNNDHTNLDVWYSDLKTYLMDNGGLYVDAATNGNRFYAAQGAVPTLGMVRGKVVIFNRSFKAGADVTGIDGTGCVENTAGSVQNTSFLADPAAADFGVSSQQTRSLVTYHYQCIYDDQHFLADPYTQANAITANITAAATNTDPRNWYTTSTGRANNFLVTSGAFALGPVVETTGELDDGFNKYTLTRVTNVPVTNGGSQRTVGTISGDFYNDTPGFIEAIYQRNALVSFSTPVAYDFAAAGDRVLPVDYMGTGRSDHLICYRPGAKTFWIMKSLADGTFRAVWKSSTGIGGADAGYDLADSRDRIVPLQTGDSMFTLLAYRPGVGTAWVLCGTGSSDYSWGPGFGINQQHSHGLAGTFDLSSDADRMIRLYSPGDDQPLATTATLFCYRPGGGPTTVLRHAQSTGWNDPNWLTAFTSHQGIDAHFDFSDSRDTAFAMDYSGSGHLDHLVCYRPGAGRLAVYRWNGSTFTAVVTSTTGVPGAFALTDPADQITAIDYSGNGHLDSLLCYRSSSQPYLQAVQARPGTAAGFTARNSGRSSWADSLDAYPLARGGDTMVAFNYKGSTVQNNVLIYRPGGRTVAVLGNRSPASGGISYGLGYWSAPGGLGNGSYQFDDASTLDVLMPYDYTGTGKPDHILCRRSSAPPNGGLGQFWILQNRGGGGFLPLLHGATGIPCAGGGNYDLKGAGDDRVTPFCVDPETGKSTDLVAWRVGGICWVLQNRHDGTYTPVFQSASGIADFDLKSATGDHVVAYDYDLRGAENHLMVYRTGTTEIGFLTLRNGQFADVARSHTGLPGTPTLNRVIPFDYTGTGTPQQLLCWGERRFTILQNYGPGSATRFKILSQQSAVAGYTLTDADQISTFDYTGTGKASDLVIYRPGTGAVIVLQNLHDGHGGFRSVYVQGTSGGGIGGFDLAATTDAIFGYDFTGTLSPRELAVYRPGAGQIWMLQPQEPPFNFHPMYLTGSGLGF